MIRPALHSDIPALLALVSSFFANGELDGTGLSLDADTVEFFIQDSIDLEERCVLVVEEGGELIGAIAGGVQPWMFNANLLLLMELGWFVPKQHRDRYPRAAITLLRAFQDWGRGKGATSMVIVSTRREESERVKQFYDKMGLQHIDSNYIGRL